MVWLLARPVERGVRARGSGGGRRPLDRDGPATRAAAARRSRAEHEQLEGLRTEGVRMAATGTFARELYDVVAARHSKDHPVIGMIERGELSEEQLLGFAVQFYQLFPKVFPKPIAALYARCPDDPEIEKHLLENLIEEGTGQVSGSASHRDLYLT